MKTTPRTRKLNESVREALAEILVDGVSDPRLAMVTVTSAEVASDARYAIVYVTAHGGPERYEEVLAGLDSAGGRIRSALGRRVRLKFVPELEWRIDDSVDEGMRIAEALRDVPPGITDAGDDELEAAEDGDGPPDDAATAEEDSLP